MREELIKQTIVDFWLAGVENNGWKSIRYNFIGRNCKRTELKSDKPMKDYMISETIKQTRKVEVYCRQHLSWTDSSSSTVTTFSFLKLDTFKVQWCLCWSVLMSRSLVSKPKCILKPAQLIKPCTATSSLWCASVSDGWEQYKLL